jgi:hypothetical protein
VTPGKILSTALSPSNQQLKFVLLDCIWRFLWCCSSLVASFLVVFAVFVQMGSLEWEGPDLGESNPIIVFAALRQFWNSYGGSVLAAFGVLLLVMVILWIALEALFRGGRKGLWLYAGTAAARTTLLGGTAAIFIMLAMRDDSRGTLLIGGAVMIALWLIVGIFETVLRRDAVDLLATSLLPLSAVVGSLRLAEGGLAFVLLGSAFSALLQTTELALTGMFAAFVVMFWMVVQSYLVAVRYSAIDIMRRNVVRA